jgi:arylsulfatase A-like enzyme/lipoprotein NlpI
MLAAGVVAAFAVLVPCRAENVLLISIDTLRADRLSCYGYTANATPQLDRWAREGVLFSRAYTACPLTLPAHATVLTGTYPLYHGVRDNVGHRLPESAVTAAELFREKGYRTAAILGAYVLASPFGTGQGFDLFDDDFGDLPEDPAQAVELQRPAPEVAERALARLRDYHNQKFFLFIHFYDPHLPRPQGYDAEVSRVDEAVGKIDRYLRESGLLQRTHILVFGDHGEGLGEHGESTHGFFLYDSTLHVPLIVRPAESFQAKTPLSDDVVSLADVLPTLLQLAGLPIPPSIQGRSLVRSMLGLQRREEGAYAETWVPWNQFGWSPLRALVLGRWKYIDAPQPELYDLPRDRNEQNNLAASQPLLARQQRERLTAFHARYSQSSENPQHKAAFQVDTATEERLAALGYVALSRPAGVRTAGFGEGIDPKLRIQAFEKHTEILADLADGRVSPSRLQELQRLRSSAPEMAGLDFLEAAVLEASGDPAAAERKYSDILKGDPGHRMARSQRSALLLRRGALDEAQEDLEELLSADPGDYRARNNLASIFRRRGQTEQAIAQLRRAVADHPRYFTGWYHLGLLYIEQAAWVEAEAALRRAVELRSDHGEAHLNLAMALNALGRTEEAARHLELAKP